jgi:hypothetical protein
MRTYTNSLVFENIFDTAPTIDVDLIDLYTSITTPRVQIIELNCGTTSGKLRDVTYRIVGETELSTNLPLSRSRIDQLLSSGIYKVATAHTATCTSTGGICQRCYQSDFPKNPIPAVGSYTLIPPEAPIKVDIMRGTLGTSYFQLSDSPSLYKRIDVYIDGLLQMGGYTVGNDSITLSTPLTLTTSVVVKYIDDYYLVFLKYLASSYSGSLIGIKEIPDNALLPIKTSLLSSLISKNKLELIRNKLKGIPSIPQNFKDYLDTNNIPDTLEESLLMISLYNVFSNAA